MEEGRYIYGIIKANERPKGVPRSEASPKGDEVEGRKSFGLGGVNASGEVYTIAHQDISCVVSNSTIQDYSSMLKETLGHYLVKHQTIIERIMREYTIIPMKFGTNLTGEDEIIEVLKRGYPQFKELLVNMDGKIELDVACTWGDLNNVIKEIGEEVKEIREFKAEIAKRPSSETLQDRIKVGMMVKDALDKRREKEQTRIVGSLEEITVDFQKHQVMDDKMILNCAFLLEKSREPDFDVRLKELDKEYKQKVNFRCVGPLPPYSFATCQLKKVEFSQINEARKLLGLKENTSLDEIKESYRKLAQKNHPDKNPENSRLKEEFEKITQAYKLLTSCYQQGGISFENDRERPSPAQAGKDLIMVEIIRP